MEISLYIAVAAGILGIAGCVFAYTQKRRIDKVFKLGGKDLEKELTILKEKISKNNTTAESLRRDVSEYFQRAEGAIQKTAFERYDAYEDVGGAQSFVLILLDAKDNGVLINAIHGRTGTRVYGKNVSQGKVETTLSEEERKALNSLINKP